MGSEKTRRKKTRRKTLCRETAVLGGDAVVRAKVGSEGGVEVVVKTGGSRGYETAFLKMRVGHLLRREVEGEEKVDCEGCGKKRSPWGGAGTHRGCRKDSRGGERVGRKKE